MRAERKEELNQFNRRSILKHANDLFGESGVGSTSIEDIVKRSGYCRATVYAYFKSKEDILHHLLLDCFGGVRTALAENADDSFAGFYRALCAALLRVRDDYPGQFIGLLGTIHQRRDNSVDASVVEAIRVLAEEIDDAGADWIRKGKKAGLVRKNAPPLESFFHIWSSLCGLLHLSASASASSYLDSRLDYGDEAFLAAGFAAVLRQITDACNFRFKI